MFNQNVFRINKIGAIQQIPTDITIKRGIIWEMILLGDHYKNHNILRWKCKILWLLNMDIDPMLECLLPKMYRQWNSSKEIKSLSILFKLGIPLNFDFLFIIKLYILHLQDWSQYIHHRLHHHPYHHLYWSQLHLYLSSPLHRFFYLHLNHNSIHPHFFFLSNLCSPYIFEHA